MCILRFDGMECAIINYACYTPHGNDTRAFCDALFDPTTLYPQLRPRFTWGISSEPALKNRSLELLCERLLVVWGELRSGLDAPLSDNLGVILASTKGCIDDFVWDPARFRQHRGYDPLTPVLNGFLKGAQLSPKSALCVSNACASSLSALFLAERWLKQKRVDQVLVLAADRVGPFVEKGFQTLQAISASVPKPFAEDRDGFRLGEGAAAVLVAADTNAQHIRLVGSGIDAEGFAVTRPSPAGESIKRAYKNLRRPDLIVAHGTATSINDAVEDQAFFDLFGADVAITGTKWLLGHTLGASGLLDVIAACEVLKRQRAFRIATTTKIDPLFRSSYLYGPASTSEIARYETVLISSLGFGGVHALTQLSLRDGA